MVEVNQQQTCKKCGRAQRFEYSVSNIIWQMLPEKWKFKCLCIECFIEEIDGVLGKGVRFDGSIFNFLAVVGDKFQCIIKDE